ncbi:MAG: GH116 family glycosyl-hydrolase, partial [Oscillospiraceae bacterium]
VAFPLGGIGTGNIAIGARGQLRDWEIFNSPAKGQIFPYTFFAIRTKQEGSAPQVRILESRLTPPFAKSHGFVAWEMAG